MIQSLQCVDITKLGIDIGKGCHGRIVVVIHGIDEKSYVGLHLISACKCRKVGNEACFRGETVQGRDHSRAIVVENKRRVFREFEPGPASLKL